MFRQFKNPNFYIVFIGDLIIFAISLELAYLMRFEFSLAPAMHEQVLTLLDQGRL